MDIVEFEPTKAIKILISDLSVPVDTGVEMSKIAVAEKEILLDLLRDAEELDGAEKRAVLKQALEWFRELRHITKDIHEMTKGVQERAMLKGYEIQGQIAKEFVKRMDDEELVKFVKKLEKENAVVVDSELT